MSDPAVHVARCDTAESLPAAVVLFDRYRVHYGQEPAPGRAEAWLGEMVEGRMLTVHLASIDPAGDAVPVGLATAHELPASLALGRSWQLRDLFVLPDHRRRGVAAALVEAVRRDAVAAGATRLSLVTEPDNHHALALYRGLGFVPVDGLTTLSLDLGSR